MRLANCISMAMALGETFPCRRVGLCAPPTMDMRTPPSNWQMRISLDWGFRKTLNRPRRYTKMHLAMVLQMPLMHWAGFID